MLILVFYKLWQTCLHQKQLYNARSLSAKCVTIPVDNICLETNKEDIIKWNSTFYYLGLIGNTRKLPITTEHMVWCDIGKRLGGSHINAVISVSTPILGFIAYWKKPLGRQTLSLTRWWIITGWNMKSGSTELLQIQTKRRK